MKNLSRRVVAITGASSGIGRATAIEIASRGGRVVVSSRDAAALDEVVRECEAAGGEALAVVADVTREDDLREVARRAMTRFGALDVWINNAGVILFAKFEDAPADVYRRVIDTNFFGTVHGARVALQHFRAQHRGVLINIDSVTGGVPQPYTSAYVASKFAVRALSASLRMELSLDHEDDIHVCNVMPSAIDTPIFQHAANYTGREPKALDPVYPVEKAARAIANLIVSPQAELVIGAAGKAIMAQTMITPRLVEKVFARQVDRNHLQDKPGPDTPGNLFESRGPKATEGGWRQRNPVTIAFRSASVIALTALAVAFAVGVRKRSRVEETHGWNE